jgi:hypothetical protein
MRKHTIEESGSLGAWICLCVCAHAQVVNNVYEILYNDSIKSITFDLYVHSYSMCIARGGCILVSTGVGAHGVHCWAPCTCRTSTPDTEESVQTMEHPWGCCWWTQIYGMHNVKSRTKII